MQISIRNFLISSPIITIIILADFYSKAFIIEHVSKGESIYVAPFLNIVKLWNNGVSFGLFNNYAYSAHIFSVISILISLIILVIIMRPTTRGVTLTAFSMILGGAVGNIIDRLYYGAVADFIDLHINTLHWPAFNIADAMITLGVLILIPKFIKL